MEVLFGVSSSEEQLVGDQESRLRWFGCSEERLEAEVEQQQMKVAGVGEEEGWMEAET